MITLPVDALKVLGLLVIFHYKVGSRYSIQMKRLTSPLCSTKTQSDSYVFHTLFYSETVGIIRIRITDDNNYEKSEYFYVQLGEPVLIDKDGKNCICIFI
ncbi:hypothetical protein KSF78_0001397 [Schistosoma japonicum]|nr:hypothetical protein KSF78_0001397 [Schistosoma japonicum]